MKRFLIPTGGGAGGEPESSKRARGADAAEGVGGANSAEVAGRRAADAAGEPATFLSWNANGLVQRLQNTSELQELEKTIKETDPDCIVIQEVKVAADGPGGAKRGDGRPRRRGELNTSDKSHAKDGAVIIKAMNNRHSPLSRYEATWSLSDWRYAGTAVLLRKGMRPESWRHNILDGRPAKEHHEDGRVILAEFPSFTLLNTYSPNNGWGPADFERRRRWDGQTHAFVASRGGKPLVWLGDLNVAHRDDDVTEPKFFADKTDPKYPSPTPDEKGQPGFTPQEQRRFGELLEAGSLVDTFRREAGPAPPPGSAARAAWNAGPHYTWRGAGPAHARYYARGMRIDYALVSQSMAGRVAESRVLGHGAERLGFCGSDHSPILLRLRPPGPA